MHTLITELKKEYPDLKFTASKQFYWSPESEDIFYKSNAKGIEAAWSLLHETGHALLKHKSYKTDFELIRLEVAAWEKAKQLATQFDVQIDENHIQDCLDTYRDWLYKRSICPNCTTKSMQQGDFVHYRCFNCHTSWRVTASRFCRAYRRHKDVQLPAPLHAL
ncbi:MAG: hypothetical protein ACHQT9_02070 [Candidatus Saccharimonadales bacterium]